MQKDEASCLPKVVFQLEAEHAQNPVLLTLNSVSMYFCFDMRIHSLWSFLSNFLLNPF